ncbi:hypothetical protein BDY24DRAFT_412279 [Mrakia frigida]|uniref:uncharacterized protein n=1 Tax=Mrakia frigida TaxID=29902 RepID=UPI003FCC0321
MVSQEVAYAFFFLHLFALVLTALLLLTIFCYGAPKRDPTILSLLIIFGIISPIFFDLTLFETGGRLVGTFHVDSAICLAQAGGTAGLQSMQAAGVLALVVKLFSTLLAFSRRAESFFDSIAMQVFLIVLPYGLWLSDLVATIVLARDGTGSSRLVRGDFYCRLENDGLVMAFGVINIVLYSLVATFLCITIVFFSRRYLLFRHLGGEVVVPSTLIVAFSEVDVGLSTRVVLITLYVGVAFGASTLILVDRSLLVLDLNTAAAGLVVFLVFGSQTDVLRLWFHSFHLLYHYILKLLGTLAPTRNPPPPTPTLRTDSPDPFPPQTVHLPSLPLSLHAPPSPTHSRHTVASHHRTLTRGSTVTLSTHGARTPSPCPWQKDGRWRSSLFLEEGGTAKELDGLESEEERRWREEQRKEDRELVKELLQAKREVGMIKSELVDIRREVGERGWIEDQEQEGRRTRVVDEEAERRRDQDGRSDVSSPIEEDSEEESGEETEEEEEGTKERPPRPATPGPW